MFIKLLYVVVYLVIINTAIFLCSFDTLIENVCQHFFRELRFNYKYE